MKRVVIISLGIAVFATALMACNNGEKVKLLESILDNGVLYRKFEYDNKDRIVKIIRYGSDGKTVMKTRTFTYNGNFFTVSEDIDGEIVSTKNYGKYDDKIYIQGGDEYFEFNSQNLVVKHSIKFGGIDGYERVTTYEYEGSNISKMAVEEIYGPYFEERFKKPNYDVTYTYDDKKSPLYYCKTPQWYLAIYTDWQRAGEEIGVTNNVKTTVSEGKTYTLNLEYYDDGMLKSMTSDYYSSPLTFLYKTK